MLWKWLATQLASALQHVAPAEDEADTGQGLVEYALIIMLVAIVVIVIVAALGPAVGGMYSRVIVNV